jgi:2-amino-4-hydroxy-6-hydroxymethyldihydropteridine diphosphokinase
MGNINNIAFIGIGSNKGDRTQACQNAIDAFAHWDRGSLLKVSSLYESEPWGYDNQGRFINCVIKVQTSDDAAGLFSFIQEIECRLGKQKDFHWGPRTIDLDMLLFNEEILNTLALKIPHPFLHERRFVLEPLAELEPALIHPITKQPIAYLLQRLQDSKGVCKIMERRFS